MAVGEATLGGDGHCSGGGVGTMAGEGVVVEDGDWMPLITFSLFNLIKGNSFYMLLILLRIVFGCQIITNSKLPLSICLYSISNIY
jgi:hypothetical protein